MRSPFDSYVKFWEALSGTRKERLSAGAAAAKLEEYFGQVEEDESREDRSKKPIIVLMLDEIDYLVTKKQTILCKFPVFFLCCSMLHFFFSYPPLFLNHHRQLFRLATSSNQR